MGTYLSTPVTTKNEESGQALDCPLLPLAWGAVDMQGWRKSMEDAHVGVVQGIELPSHMTTTDAPPANVSAKIFGVFDGHGGPEVARFCQLYLVSVLVQQPTWTATEESTTSTTSHSTDQQQHPKESPVGLALRGTFHALDRMIDSQTQRDELIRLRAVKPPMGERRAANDIPPPRPLQILEETTTNNNHKSLETEESRPFDEQDDDDDNNNVAAQESGTLVSTEQGVQMVDPTEKKDDDSDAVMGKEEAAAMDQDLMNDDDNSETDPKDMNENATSSTTQPPEDDAGADGDNEAEAAGTAGKMGVMLSRLLHMSSSTPSSDAASPLSSPTTQSTTTVTLTPSTTPPSIQDQGPPVEQMTLAPASVLQSGRPVCNLPDHAIHAGATAVVAVLHGKTLTVANAGDSRGVLCRGGVAFPLSFDHKPTSPTELSRIQHAGGFVNHFGRVNGNLNLSRSIGDLKYKQVATCSAAQQMITAEPDILQVTLTEEDDFFILACDGIWDCLSNQQAVDFVQARLEHQTPTSVGKEMLDEIISADPRTTQGIGGDNMTVMIVDLKPHDKTYYFDETTSTNPAEHDEPSMEMSAADAAATLSSAL